MSFNGSQKATDFENDLLTKFFFLYGCDKYMYGYDMSNLTDKSISRK